MQGNYGKVWLSSGYILLVQNSLSRLVAASDSSCQTDLFGPDSLTQGGEMANALCSELPARLILVSVMGVYLCLPQ
jgi:hypothetical protein